jgi:hypothetical protein
MLAKDHFNLVEELEELDGEGLVDEGRALNRCRLIAANTSIFET